MAAAPDAHDDATMSFGDHLEELRRRILLAGAPALPLAIGLFFFSDTFIRILVLPLRRVLESNGLPPHIQALAPPEVLLIKLKLSVILAAIALAPWIVWQLWLFIRPGLYVAERRFVHLLVPGSVVLTVAGVALLYFAMLPLMLQVLVAVGSDLDLGEGGAGPDPRVVPVLSEFGTVPITVREPEAPTPGAAWLSWPELDLFVAVTGEGGAVEVIRVRRGERARITQSYRLSTYMNFVLLLLLGVVIAFQMPLVIVLLGWVGLASPQWLQSRRRYALLVCGVLSALLTPADVVSMLMMLIPLYALYELGIALLRLAPASAVAEGTILRRPKSDKDVPPRAGSGGPDKRAGQPVEPVQSEGTVPRRPPGGADDSDSPTETADESPRPP